MGSNYYIGLAIGTDFAARGAMVTINDITQNDFKITDATFPYWGNTVVVTKFKVDASKKTISFTGTGDWGSIFDVTLTKVKF